ncbi:hypothetical protein BC828DRAFT_373987, partial [Blastocladiella britannica]
MGNTTSSRQRLERRGSLAHPSAAPPLTDVFSCSLAAIAETTADDGIAGANQQLLPHLAILDHAHCLPTASSFTMLFPRASTAPVSVTRADHVPPRRSSHDSALSSMSHPEKADHAWPPATAVTTPAAAAVVGGDPVWFVVRDHSSLARIQRTVSDAHGRPVAHIRDALVFYGGARAAAMSPAAAPSGASASGARAFRVDTQVSRTKVAVAAWRADPLPSSSSLSAAPPAMAASRNSSSSRELSPEPSRSPVPPQRRRVTSGSSTTSAGTVASDLGAYLHARRRTATAPQVRPSKSDQAEGDDDDDEDDDEDEDVPVGESSASAAAAIIHDLPVLFISGKEADDVKLIQSPSPLAPSDAPPAVVGIVTRRLRPMDPSDPGATTVTGRRAHLTEYAVQVAAGVDVAAVLTLCIYLFAAESKCRMKRSTNSFQA